MENDRGAMIRIGNREYEMLLTTRATKEIAKRYGGLEHLGEKLMQAENFELALDEVVWLITLLANQSTLVHNLLEQERKLIAEAASRLLGVARGIEIRMDVSRAKAAAVSSPGRDARRLPTMASCGRSRIIGSPAMNSRGGASDNSAISSNATHQSASTGNNSC